MSNSITAQVYKTIRDCDYAKAMNILQSKLGEFPRSRPLLSLMGYCCYHKQEFARAAEFYETLTELCPESEEYQVCYVQSLVKGGSHLDASRVASSAAATSKSPSRMRLLQAHAELEQGMLSACSTTLSQCEDDSPETIIALATLDYREGRFAKALETYKIAKAHFHGLKEAMLGYYIALCHYQLSDHDAALQIVEDIIEEKREEQTELRDSPHWQGHNRSFLAEALTLKTAILFSTKKFKAAKDSVHELCELQNNENLDTLTIHNDAIINIEEDPSIGISKLEFLLSNQPFPPETLTNLLTFYTSHGQDDLAAEAFETNKHLAQELLPPDTYAYFDAVMMSLTCPEDAFSMLETQIAQYAPKLRSGKSNLSEAIKSANIRPTTSHRPSASVRPNTAAERKGHRALTVATKEFEAILDCYIPVLMLQARLCWDRKQYTKAEQILRKSADFCHDRDAWRLNMGHIMFAQQDERFEAAIEHYEILLKHHSETDLLKVPAVALANLCVAYIMTNQNEEAEEVIKSVEREEQQQVALGNNCERTYHTCVISLIIGTLYCERGNFEFGASRICKSMVPFEKNLCLDTWYYAKRCFLALASKISKMMYIIKDDTLQDIICFFGDVERNGNHINTEKEEPATISEEARKLKNIFIKMCA